MPKNIVIGFCYISSLFLSDFVKDLKVKEFPCMQTCNLQRWNFLRNPVHHRILINWRNFYYFIHLIEKIIIDKIDKIEINRLNIL